MLSAMQANCQTIIWGQRLGSPGGLFFFFDACLVSDIELAPDSSMYVIGHTDGLPILIGSDTAETTGGAIGSVGYVAKLDAEGQLLWSFSGLGISKGYHVARDDAGNVYGLFRGVGDITIDGTIYPFSHPRQVLIKFSDTGEIIWHRFFNSGAVSSARSEGLEIDSSGDLLFSMRFSNTIIAYDSTFSGQGLSWETLICKYDSGGQSIWYNQQKELNSNNTPDEYYGMTVDPFGNTYVTASFDSLVVGLDTFNFEENSISVSKYLPTGQLEWVKEIRWEAQNLSWQMYRTVLCASENALYLAATRSNVNSSISVFYDSVAIDTIPPDPSTTPYLFKIDLDGNYVDHEFTGISYPTSSEHRITDLDIHEGTVIITGYGEDSVSIGSFKHGFGSSPNGSKSAYIAQYDTTTKEVVLLYDIQGDAGERAANATAIDLNNDIITGGHFSTNIKLDDSLEINSLGNRDAFLIKRLSCDYLTIEAEAVDSLLCTGNSVKLRVVNPDTTLNYQWYYGTTEISGANDTIYHALLPGTYSIEVMDGVCSRAEGPYSILPANNPLVSFSLAENSFCTEDSAIVLTGASPNGGQFFGPGVSAGVFQPSLLSPGNYTIGYHVLHSSGCSDTALVSVSVEAAPATVFFQSFSQACVDDSITLNSGFPAGGDYSGPGVFGNAFQPQAGDTGLITLHYTASSINGCSASDSIQVTVNAVPSVAFSLPQDSVCINDGIVSIGSAVPTGGTYGGTGVAGSFFVPMIAGPGAHSITYTYAQSGCEAVVSDTIMVDSVPSIVLEPLDSICVGADSLPLTHASPVGGTYIGSGITNNVLNASLLGIGTHSIQYVFNNACGSDTATSTISIIADPTISITPSQISCNGGNNGSLSASVTGGSGVFDFTWNTGDSSAFISSLSAGTYTVTVDNGFGCIANVSVSLTEPSALNLIIDSIDNVVCNGFSNGAAYTSVSGGVAPYTYSWSDGSTNEYITGLSSGQYTLTVTDANACEDSLTISINELTPIAINGTVDSVSCFDGADGSISTLVTGGNGSYSFLWSSGQMSSSISSIDVGSYTLTVTDTNGCFGQETFNVAQPDSMEITPTITNASCYGDANGSISLAVSGGTGQKVYQWSNSASGNALSNLTAGTYTVTVTDENGCINSASFTIGQPDSITLSINETQSIQCFGDSTGELNVASSGGVAPYTFTWSSGGMNPTESNLTAGTYAVTVVDSLGCQKVSSFNLLQPDLMQINLDSLLDPLCIGDTNGYLAVSASGGAGSLSYNWSTGDQGQSIGSLESGTYTVSVSDQNGCETMNSFQLSDPAAISIQFSVTDAQCFGDSNGSVSATIANAVVPFNVNWSNGQSGLSIDSLSAGSYSVTVTDANGCTASSSSTVSEPLALSVAAAVINSTCADDSTGSIALTVNGGSMPYAFNWSSGDTTPSIDTLAPGVYSVTVIDANACVVDSTFNIGPEPLGLTLDSLIDVACFGDSTGSIAVTGSGGNNSLNYTWSDGGVGSMRQNLSAGVYTITIDDGFATCTFDTTFTVDQPQQLQTSVDSIIAINCYGDSGSVFTHTTGGVEPYTFNWSNSSASQDLIDVVSGSYTLSITDSNACASTFSIELPEPDSLLINPTLVNLVCENEPQGSISLAVTGGTAPYEFQWSTGSTDSVISSLMATTYAVTITDSNDCNAERSYSLSFDIGAPVIDLGNDTALCANDSIVLNAAIESGSYDWSNGSVDSMIIGFPGLTYSVTVSNTEGCSSTDSITLSSLNLPIFDLGNDTMICGAILDLGIDLQGPENMQTYLWSTGGQQSTETVFSFGVYSLTVTDSNTCWYTDSIALEPDTCTGLPDKLSSLDILVFPNPTSDKLYVRYPHNTEPAELRLITFDGKLIEKSSLLDQQVLDMSLLPTGVYFLEVRSSTGTRFIRRVVKS